jgi:hypothetical protein
MFLFRRKNENNKQPAADPTKAEILRPDKNKKSKPEKAKGQIVEAESVVETIEKAQADFPDKVVSPASALKEEAAQNPAVESALPLSGVPDEVADSLLTPGHQGFAKTAVDPAAARPAAAPDPAPATIPDPKKAIQAGEGKDNMFSSLFGNAVEEEENILDRLFKSLPEISMEEILREAEEVKSLIKEFSKSQVG